ncbi:MAG: 2-succinylbenzoate--CoA ligase [Oscillatoriales cyanobacterium RU_3_3]|nr:2-succinylbenzoate--CoA ligase [Oscillatoriales cyanobacterium RU_3_3]NJR22494.1 2-succinylbenzoate--CoA ligase [Richelia sp. CSU_2_1]
MTENIAANILEIASKLPENWLIGCDSSELLLKIERQVRELTKIGNTGAPKVCLSEPEPINFIASFIAACATKCQIFLCNPNWVQQEWQQVFDLIQPDRILGKSALQNLAEINSIAPPFNNYKNHPKLPITNYQLPITDSQFPIPNSQLPLIMIPTGGSSGKIRFAVHTWETLTASVRGFQEYFHIWQINSFCVLPLYHVSGLMQLLRSFTTSGKLATKSFKSLETGGKCEIEPEEFFISLVPTQLQRLLQNPDTANWLSRFHTVLLGGAPAWPELLATARNYQIKLALTYGMTETASQIATLKPGDFLAGNHSSGQILPHAKVTICGENGEILSYNETGNICINAKSLALGYYPEIWRSSEYLQLDDLGFFDKNNFLNIVGRNSDKIITGGENVFPIEVEAAIRSTDLVADICTIGLPDKHWGQAVTAVYVPANSQVTVTALQRAIEDKLSKFKRPKYWVEVAQLPRNSQGKINRKQLHELAAMSTGRSI